MDDAFYPRILLEYSLGRGQVSEVYFLESWQLARDFLYAVEHFYLGVGQVVDDDHVVAGLYQFYGGVAADEARATRHQNCLFHHIIVLLVVCSIKSEECF